MHKDGDRGLDRAEEAFAALSSKEREEPPAGAPPAVPPKDPSATAGEREPGRGPWGIVALLLLLLSAGLGVALFAVSSRARTERERLRADAQAKLLAAQHMREKLERNLDALVRAQGRLKARLGARESVLVRARNGVAMLVAGRPEAALASLQKVDEGDELSPVVRVLAERLAALDRAEAAPADERIAALAELGDDWPLDAVALRRERDEGRRDEELTRRRALDAARGALFDDDLVTARERIADAVGEEAGALAAVVRRVELRRQAEAREARGDLTGAAAFYRVLGAVTGSEAATESASRIEEESARLRLASFLKRAAEDRLSGGEFEASAAMLRALGDVTGVDASAAADATRALGLRREAARLRSAGEPEAALHLAREAAKLGNPSAADLAEEIARQIAADRERVREHLEAEFRARATLDRALEDLRAAVNRQ